MMLDFVGDDQPAVVKIGDCPIVSWAMLHSSFYFFFESRVSLL
jgi:hypothetical protein